jgi:hypothetical protein
MPHINRYAAITAWDLNTVTEKSMNVSVYTDRTADLFDYQVNDGEWVRGYTGGFTGASVTIPNLLPNTTYNIRVRVRNASGGLYTTSGLKAATTNPVTITSYTLSGLTDTSISMNVKTSHVADRLEYMVDNSGTWILVPGDFTNKTATINMLTSNTTYSVQVRARHKDSQTYTPTQTKTASTSFPTPLQPTNLNPSAGKAVGVLNPALRWTFTSTSPDTQGAYQVLLYPESSTTAIWDSGKVASGNNAATVPLSVGLTFNANYQWKVRTWSANDIVGPYSSLGLFKTSNAPTATITAPTALQVFNTDAPVITWTYADPESTAQTGFGVTVKRIATTGATDGDIVHTATIANSADTSYLVPTGILDNGARYIVQVTVTDSDGISGVSSWREFSISFIAPPNPNIDAEVSEDKLFARISVTPNMPANDSFDSDVIRIFKRIYGETDWSYVGEVSSIRTYLDPFENSTDWTPSGTGATVGFEALSKQGTGSLSLRKSSSGTATYTNSIPVGSIIGYDKIRVWIYTKDDANITSIKFKFGTDASNYFSFTVPKAQLADLRWTSIEVDYNALTITGSPSFGNIAWKQIEMITTGAIVAGDVLVDSWNLATTGDSQFIYDYALANNTIYEYAASAYNSREGLESGKTVFEDTISVVYSDLLNTYLIPIGAETGAIATFMDGKTVPAWKTSTDTEYYKPIGARTPVVYSLGNQKYKSGTIQVRFFDELFNGKGLTGVKNLEAIMNNKPLLLRTWWGENYYISIDGELAVERSPGIGWFVTFNFTEIGE